MTLPPTIIFRLTFLCAALAALGGCVVAGPGYYGYGPGYDDCGYYGCGGYYGRYYGGYYGPAYYGPGPGFYFSYGVDHDKPHRFRRFHH